MKLINQLFIIGVTAALISSCSSDNTPRNEAAAVNVEVYEPMTSSNDGFTVSGVLASQQQAVISTRMMAYVDQILVKQGDKVGAGQLLIRLNASDIKAKYAQVKAQYTEVQAAAKNAVRDYERFKKLHEQQSVSDKEFENIELNKVSMLAKEEMVRQSLNEVKAMLAYTDIKAPFSGVVAQKLVEKGNMAQPGMPLLVIEQPGEMEVRASVPENYIHNAKVGDKVAVDVKSLGYTLDGRISELSSSASLTGGQYTMKVKLENNERKDLLSGMYLGIRLKNNTNGQNIATDKEEHIWIDKSSLVKREQLRGVYVVNEGRAQLRWVRTGKEDGQNVEVLSGLKDSESVIRKSDGKLFNGRKVTVTK